MHQQQPPPIQKIHIGYATETSNAYQLALQTHLCLQPLAQAPVPITTAFTFAPNNLYLLFISTTGQGDPPYSMRPFWKAFMSKSYGNGEGGLGGVRFGVYGLGDRGYGDNFNIVARKCRQRLLMLGAQEVVDIGLGDQQDRNGCFGGFFQKFYPELCGYLAKLEIKCKPQVAKNLRSLKRNQYSPYKFIIKQQKLLSSRQQKDVYQILLQTQISKGEQIKLGDILQIFPHNRQPLVQETYQYFMQNNLNDIKLSEQQLKSYLRQVANLQNVVNFTFFSTKNQGWFPLWDMLASDLESSIKILFTEKLKQLGQDYDEYYNYIKKYRRNVVEVITDFSLKIPLSCFVQRLGSIISRKYSISRFDNHNGDGKTIIGLLISLQKYKVSSNRVIKGLCSHDLCLSKLENSIRVGKILRNGEFQLITDFHIPIKIVMISLGTGIAPFLSILDKAAKNENKWELTLFHSSRYLNQLPISKQIMEKLTHQNKLKTFLTYTREKQGIQNRRLQFLIKDNLQQIEKAKQGKIMMCGPKQFCEIVCRVLEEGLGFDVKKMKKQKIICVQNW